METLAPLRPRHDGWTPERQWAFIQALADSGTVAAAARAVGMTRETAYRLRRHPAAADFRKAWDAAQAEGWRRVQDAALDRVLNGETDTRESNGVTTVRHRPCAPQLMIRMMDRAIQMQAAARAAADAEVAALLRAQVDEVRAEIRALADPDWVDPDPDAPRKAPVPDAETLVMRRLHDLAQGFFEPDDWDVPAPWEQAAAPKQKRENL
ncbi:MAG: hypothetical protein ACOYLS_15005 [Polymorphobacter sp.]